MPAEYQIDSQRGCVFSSAKGVFTDQDILSHQAALASDPAFSSELDQLWDFGKLDRVELSSETIRTLAQENPFGAGSRRAFFVPTPLAFGLARMFQSYADESEDDIAVFWTRSEAIQWLGFEESPA